jgi:protein gp37
MSVNSTIEWTDATWIRSAAAPRSVPAANIARPRPLPSASAALAGHCYQQGFGLRLVPEKLAESLPWSSPKTVFVNSMSDPFHEVACTL